MSGGGGSSVKVKIPGYLQGYSQDVLSRASQEADKPYTPYTGVRVPDFSAQENSYLAGPYKADFGKADTAADTSAQSWIDPGVAQSYMNPYITGVADVAARDLERQYQKLQRNAKGQAIDLGAWGDQPSGVAQSERDRNYLQDLKDMYTQQYANAYQSGAGIFNQDRAAKSAAAKLYEDLGTQKTALAKDAAGYQRSIEQMKADADYQDYITERDWNKNTLSWFSQLIGQQPAGQTQTSSGGGSGTANSLIGGALMAASIAAPLLLSDEAVKRDIEPIGDALSAIKAARPATYRYLPGVGHRSDRHAGIIAQSVESIPGAVVEIDGIKHVDPLPVIAFLVRAVQQLSERRAV